MRFPDWLDADPPRQRKVAKHFGLTVSAISQWRTNGVPRGRMLSVRKLSKGAVTLDEMVGHKKAAA